MAAVEIVLKMQVSIIVEAYERRISRFDIKKLDMFYLEFNNLVVTNSPSMAYGA